jgi:ribosomal protein S18 acetylase RimI-like enzyme
MPTMRNDEVLSLFDRQLRRDYANPGPGVLVERAGNVVREIGTGDGGWCAVLWSDLDERTADAAIAEQLRRFKELGRAFEWKLYSHDLPSDLGGRLAAAGLVPQEPEALMVAEVAGLPREPVLPEGVRIERVRDAEGVELVIRAHHEAFGEERTDLADRLRAQIRQDPDSLTAIVVLAGDRPVCAGRMEFHEGTRFASLWGGGTAPEWRGRGIYRATVAYRARLAAERGFDYLQVDASPDSRPILARLGFQVLSTTTPYEYEL